MTALIVIFVIALVICALLLLRVKFVIRFSDELALYAKILFVRINLFPKKEKKIRISDYKKKNYEKRKRKEAEKQKKKAAEKAAKQKQKASPEKKKEKMSAKEAIRLIRLLLPIFLRRFFGHLRIEVARLNISVAAEDAAKTAVMYGCICQGVAYIVELLDMCGNLRRNRGTQISVAPDFTSEKITADIHIALSITVAQALGVLLRTGFAYIKSKLKGAEQI